MEFLKIILAAAACYGIGAIYYTVFSNYWLKLLGKTREEIGASVSNNTMPFIIAGIAQIICAGMMRHIFNSAGIHTIGAGALAGAGIGAFIVGAWIFTHNGYEGKSMKLSLFNTGYSTLGLAAAGAVLGAF